MISNSYAKMSTKHAIFSLLPTIQIAKYTLNYIFSSVIPLLHFGIMKNKMYRKHAFGTQKKLFPKPKWKPNNCFVVYKSHFIGWIVIFSPSQTFIIPLHFMPVHYQNFLVLLIWIICISWRTIYRRKHTKYHDKNQLNILIVGQCWRVWNWWC